MHARSRKLRVLLTVGYLLTVTVSSAFHTHHPSRTDASQRPGFAASPCCGHEGDCPVCRFLAQKPVATAEVFPQGANGIVREVAEPCALQPRAEFFTAWQSRGPPLSV